MEPKTMKKKTMKNNALEVQVSLKEPIKMETGTSSVELRKTASGDVTYTIKVYNSDAEKAVKTASRLFTGLKKKYK